VENTLLLNLQRIFNNVTTNVMKSGAGPASRDLAKADSMVLAMVPDRNNKRQAPPPLVPTDRWTPAEAIDHIQRNRTKTIAFMAGTPALRAHVADSPLGSLDAYEWLLFTAAHSVRHTNQILELKADPKFSKKLTECVGMHARFALKYPSRVPQSLRWSQK
jgi:hypothetical protein